MEYTAAYIEKAIHQFYFGASGQQEVHSWLTQAQVSPAAWTFSWQLLNPDKSAEVQFYGASCLHAKISRFWHEVPADKIHELRHQLLERIFNFAKGPKMVLTRLCIALSSLIIHTVPETWEQPIKDIVTTFQQTNIADLEPSRICTILLEILTVLPEEFLTAQNAKTRRIVVRAELDKGVHDVIGLLQSLMVASAPPDVYNQSLKAFSSWVQFGVPINETMFLIQQVFQALTDPGTFDTAIDCLVNIFQHRDTPRYSNTVMMLFSNLLQLQPMLHKAVHEKDYDTCHSLCRLFVTAAENHTKSLLDSVLMNTPEKSTAMTIVHVVLQCSAMPGYFPTDETSSELAFGFWYILQDDIISSDHQKFQQYVQLFSPVYMQLVQILLVKVQFPNDSEYEQWSKEEKEQHRCYRQDIADTMMYAYNILRQPLIAFICALLCSSLENWQEFEAALFLLSSIAESVEFEESQFLPTIFRILPNIPFGNHMKLISTALVTIGAYAEWMNFHPQHIGCVLPLLLQCEAKLGVQGLSNDELAQSATLALKDLTRECQDHMSEHVAQILHTSQEALSSGKMKSREMLRLMSSVGHVLSVCSLGDIMLYLNTLLAPHIQQLQSFAEQQPSTHVKSGIIVKVNMLSSLFGSLNTIKEDSDEEGREKPSKVGNELQPVLLILQQIMPVLESIVQKWISDAAVIEAVCDVYRKALRSLMDAFLPLANDVARTISKMYSVEPHGAILCLAKELILIFIADESFRDTGRELFYCLISKTLSVLQAGARDSTDVLDVFVGMVAQLLKKQPKIFLLDGIDMAGLFQAGILGMCLPEHLTIKSSCAFLVEYMNKNDQIPAVNNVVASHGHSLVETILRAIGGETPRAVMDSVCDVLLTLNKHYSERSRKWLNEQMAVDGFPSSLVTSQEKETFVKLVLRERGNKRKLREIVKEFTLKCRGLIGTEYAAQLDYGMTSSIA